MLYASGMVDTTVHAARRARLSELIDTAAWFPAGRSLPRNYAGNPHPYRASSHFLYFVGVPLEGASLLLEGGAATLFVEPPSAEDALWHGPSPSLEALATELGCRVRPLAELAVSAQTATIPGAALQTRAFQERELGRTLGSEADHALANAVVSLRLVHDEAAVRELRRASDATVVAHRAGMTATRPGITEAVVRAAMEAVFIERDFVTAYGSIVTVRGEVLHNHDHSGELADGDLLLADVGAETDTGWTGDVTRTWPVSGTFSTTQREIYDVVLAAQLAAIDMCRPGVGYRDVHLKACKTIAEGLVSLGILRGDPAELVADGVHALLFPHGLGHLLGLDVHDMEDLGDRAAYAPGRHRSEQFGLAYLRLDRDLAPGMVVTVEPGFYAVPAILNDDALCAVAGDRLDRGVLAKFDDVRGIRIEDDVLITEDGAEVLTRELGKTTFEIEALLA